jgi:hypothetical protein
VVSSSSVDVLVGGTAVDEVTDVRVGWPVEVDGSVSVQVVEVSVLLVIVDDVAALAVVEVSVSELVVLVSVALAVVLEVLD